ncbi:hypothetical protein BDF21DRAFT_433909 [Thamnidium elegans]|nr:hypothetical protein BDF21DRAFT_433909 [Thamnidium elegans]
MENNSSPMMVPIWAIVIIVIVVVAIIIIIFFFLRRRRTRSYSVETIHQEKTNKEIKKSESLASFQTLVTQQKQRSMKFEEPCITTTPLPDTPKLLQQKQKQEEEETTSPHHNQKTDQAASILDESEYCDLTPEPPQEIKISLPLPPPSTSFFSDKMELDDDHAQDLYDKYLNMSPNTTKPSEFMSIDFESNNSSSGPSFYTNATTNIQQKAATIKTSLYQSLRLQQKGNRTTAQNMFAGNDNNKPKYSGDSYEYQPEKKPIQNSSTITTDSNKTIIDMRVLDLPTKPALHHLNVTKADIITIEDESPITPYIHLQEPVRAAKRVIRTASRKTKTRSMVVNDPDFLPAEEQEEGNQLFGGTVKEDKRVKHGSVRFASFRGPRNSGEHMTITSGSMRRLVRESILFDDSSMPSMPVASSAAMASTRNNSSRKSGGVSAVDIASWWDSNNTPNKNNNSATTVTSEVSDNNNALPLFKNVSAGSNSSSTPNQYRASLSTSIFGTLSKSSGAVLSEVNKEEQGSMSRNNSFRRGTLSRNTLRNLTAGANNVNRSIKGLFDHSANTSSNRIVPDDSQKMELDSEPIQLAVEEKTTVNQQEQQIQQQQYNSVRQKSVRNTSRATRPSLPSTYLPSSESSTKYALSDEECFEDDCSKETASTDQTRVLAKLEPVQQVQRKKQATSEPNGEVDTIRRMLQDTWINNMKESGSMFSIASEADSVATNSTQPSVSTTTSAVSKLLNPRQQNQSLLTKSLLINQPVSQRTSLLASKGRKESNDFVPQQGPQPSASFSSSTVRTMVPEHTEAVQVRQNAITNNGSNKVQESSFEDRHHNSVLTSNRFSTTSTAEPPSSARNSSADSSRGHSRKSSGGNSAATALRISSGYSVNAKTWNGRANQKRLSRPSVTLDEDVPSTPDSSHLVSPAFQSIGPSGANKRAFFSTMRKGQKHRGSIPWMDEQDDNDKGQERTPAQIERDRYLEGKF